MDFGTIKNTFTQTYIDSHVNENSNGKELYKKFLAVLKENETLKNQFILYKNIESKTIDTEVGANEYLKECLSLMEVNSNFNVECQKLVDILEENEIELLEPTKLHESIHTLLTTEKSVKNLDTLHESKTNIIKHLMTEKVEVEEDKSNVRENIDVQKFLNVATEKYNEKYSTLSEEEKNIIKVLRNGDADSKKELLNNMIKETVSMVNDRLKSVGGNMELKEKLLETKDVIYNMSDFNGETFGEDIKKLYNIKSVFS
jgi:hypothetical protein